MVQSGLKVQAEAHPGAPTLILPSLQVNIRAGALPRPRPVGTSTSSC